MRIDRIAAPTREQFREQFQRPARPVIITGLIDDWPARRWTLDSLHARFGTRTVTAVRTRDGSVEHGPAVGVPYEPLKFGDYLDRLASGERPDRYVIFPFDEVLPELLDDVVKPAYCRDASWFRARFWLSAAHTRGPLHRDPPDNLFAQVLGRKHVVLFAPSDRKHLYPHPMWSSLPDFSRADACAPDYDRFPALRKATRIECEVGPGEVLYLPRWWWHQFTSVELSASVNLWWADGLYAAFARLGHAYVKLRKMEW